MKDFRLRFPALEEVTYLNSCSSGLFTREILQYRRNLDEEFQIKGSDFRAGVYSKLAHVKTTMASIFGCDAERTALIPSFSIGINMAADHLDSKLKVLHLEGDYPSIVWPFESRGFNCKTVALAGYTVEHLMEAIDGHKPDILALSITQYSSGSLMAPSSIKRIKEHYPDLLVMADGTQFLGTMPFDFDDSGMDFFGASAFKWLCAGYGNGVMFFSPRMQALISSRIIGYTTYKNPRREGEPTFGERFEPGHQDLLCFLSLQFSATHFDRTGFDRIQAQIKKVKNYAWNKITSETKLKVRTYPHEKEVSSILSIDAPKDLVKYLNGNKVVCSYNRGLRLGIHAYNEEADVDRMMTLIKKWDS